MGRLRKHAAVSSGLMGRPAPGREMRRLVPTWGPVDRSENYGSTDHTRLSAFLPICAYFPSLGAFKGSGVQVRSRAPLLRRSPSSSFVRSGSGWAHMPGRPLLNRGLDGLGTTIFAEMSALAAATGAINLGQGFPDTDGPAEIAEAAVRAIRDGRGNQYPPGIGVPELRRAISEHQQRFYGLAFDPDTEV